MTTGFDMRTNSADAAGRDRRLRLALPRLRLIPADQPRFVLPPYKDDRWSIWRRLRALFFLALLAFVSFFYGATYALLTPFAMIYFGLPVVVLFGLALWAMPDVDNAPLQLIFPLFFALVIATILWPYYLAVNAPGFLITIARLLGYPLLAVFLICLSMSSQLRKTIGDALAATPVIWKLLAVFVVIQFVTIAFSPQISNSINRFIVAQTSWTALYFISCYVFLTRGRVDRWIYILWFSALILCGVGIWEYRIEHSPWANHIPKFIQIDQTILENILTGSARAATGKYRVQSVFTTSLAFSEFLALTTPFVIHLIVGRYGLVTKIAAAASLPVIFYTIIITDSRLGALGFLLSGLLYVFAWAFLRWRRLKDSIIAPAIIVAYPAIFCAAMAATFVVGRLRAIVWGNGPQAASDASRREQWEIGIPKVLKWPLGHGPGTGGEVLGYTNPAGVGSIDSYFLSMLLEYGIIGFFVFYGIIIAGVVYCAKLFIDDAPRMRASREYSALMPVGIALTVFFVIKTVLSQQDNHHLIFVLLGLLTALVYRVKSEAARDDNSA